MEKRYCTWSNTCGKTICCAYCDEVNCAERCKDDYSTCKYIRAQETPKISVKMEVKEKPLKKWDKDKL